MKTIYKYELEVTDFQFILMPIGAEILTVKNQDEKVMLWAIVDTDQLSETRNFEILGTGNKIPTSIGTSREYISTIQMGNGLVWHVFEYTGI